MTRMTTDTASDSSTLAILGLVEYLRCDQRPTFILDKTINSDTLSISQLVFVNDALRSDTTLLDSINRLLGNEKISTDIDAQALAFLSWLSDQAAQGGASFHGLTWSSTCLHQRWTIVSGLHAPDLQQGDQYDAQLAFNHSTISSTQTPHKDPSSGKDVSSHPGIRSPEDSKTASRRRSPSVLARAFGVKASPHNLMVLGFDWAKTTLGAIETWPQVLRQLVPFMLNGLQPGIISWGPERTLIYNEAYVSLIKDMHPGALGSSARRVFGPLWDTLFEPEYRAAEQHGAMSYENKQVYLDRSGFLEETYFTYALTPIWDEDGNYCGVDSHCFETTRQTVVEARMLSLLKISESATSVTSLHDFWPCLARAMAGNVADFPLFAIYALDDADLISNTTAIGPDSPPGRTSLVLRGSAGFPRGHTSIPHILDTESDVGFGPAFRAVSISDSPLLFCEGNDVLDPDLLHGCDASGLKLKYNQIVVCPLHSSTRKVVGFIALGINPHRPYDDEYKIFVRLLSRQIETQLSPVLSLVKEKIAAQIKAEKSEYEQMLLTTRLQQQTLEARRSELRFLRFAEQAPIGVYILGRDGEVKFANKAWFKLAGIQPEVAGTRLWRLNTHPDDMERIDEQWERLLAGQTQENFEWRVLRPNPQKGEEVMYLRASCFPELGDDGKVTTITGVLMDLSLERAQQRAQSERLNDALESKRAQEYFMDMVSHEIRNPLHAVLQLAEETSSLLNDMKSDISPNPANSLIESCTENIQTIIYCGHHQKQILDDVLTLSKLNSDMLTLSLTDTDPATVVTKVLKFFDSDIRLSNIDISVDMRESLAGSKYSSVLMDSGRVLQILFNLIGNAIKFMKDRPTRKLTVTVQMTPNKPKDGQLHYLHSGKEYIDPTADLSQGTSQVVYICYSVKDTGPGLSIQQMDVLFERFKQGSPKTHSQYGGSGLGLFISRELAERHGGGIGLASVVDEGSTFAFYVKCLTSKQERLTNNTSHNPMIASQKPTTMTSAASSNLSDSTKPVIQRTSSSIHYTNVLIVEDNIVNQKVLDRQLRKLGYQTRVAGNGLEALSVLKESTWWHEPILECFNLSVILCDLEMPIMDGTTCVRTIREWQQKKMLDSNIPIVALTGNARTEQIQAAKAAGFDDVVSKPYSMQSLIALIEKLVQTP